MRRLNIVKTKPASFPLYDKFASQGGDSEKINVKIWSQFRKLDLDNATIIYYLILHYARLNGNREEAPYANKVLGGGCGVLYDVDMLPSGLRVILANCINEMTSI